MKSACIHVRGPFFINKFMHFRRKAMNIFGSFRLLHCNLPFIVPIVFMTETNIYVGSFVRNKGHFSIWNLFAAAVTFLTTENYGMF